MNVMFDCVCECTDFKHNFKSEKETKIALGSLAELPRIIWSLTIRYNSEFYEGLNLCVDQLTSRRSIAIHIFV